MQGALLLDVIVREGATVLKLLAGKDQTLLMKRVALLVLDLGLDIVNGVRTLVADHEERTPLCPGSWP